LLELHYLRPPAGAVRDKRRRGLGQGSGLGRTAGRGNKGQKSRSGYSRKPGFEGGQMPLQRRLPKRGFTNIFRKEYAEVNVARLEPLAGEKEITPELLLHHKVIRKVKDGVKILGHGEISKPVVVRAHAFSASARSKIEAAGGRAEVIGK
jgi:large subunit ribosomal protein L15